MKEKSEIIEKSEEECSLGKKIMSFVVDKLIKIGMLSILPKFRPFLLYAGIIRIPSWLVSLPASNTLVLGLDMGSWL